MNVRLSICILLLASIAEAPAQVASHAAATAPTKPTIASEKPVATVNGAVLTERDLVREMYVIFPYARVHNGFPKTQEAQIRKGALDMIVFEELVYQDALRRKVPVSAARVSAGLRSYRREFKSQAEFDAYLQSECQGSQQVLRNRIKRSLLIDDALKSQVENKSIVTEAELRDFYTKTGGFSHPEMFEIQSISIMPKGKSAQPLEDKKRAEDAAQQAKKTKTSEEFGMLAEKLSDDDFRVNMGKHKAIGTADLPPSVLNILRGMKVGEVSGLIPVENSYTIVRLNAHTPAGKEPFAGVRSKLKQDLTEKRKEQLRSALAKRLKTSAKVEIL